MAMRTWLVAGLLALVTLGGAGAREVTPPVPAPELTQDDPFYWINSQPLDLADLRGQVVLVDFWAFECWNCYRSFPWLNSLEAKYEDQGLKVIGVHTPEFEREKVKASVEAKAEEFGLDHPIMMDNEFAYWRAMGNRYWPAYYLIDKKGQVRAFFFGETHAGDKRAEAIESTVERLLAESG